MTKTIVLASDHGGFELKKHLLSTLSKDSGLTLLDLGTHNKASVDYPDFAQKAVDAILTGTADLGILICGTGIGISIKANRNNGIRAAVVHSEFTAEMAKAHNNANILCLGERTTDKDFAARLVEIWLKTDYEGERHQRRLEKLDL